jgi:hypothetical protein
MEIYVFATLIVLILTFLILVFIPIPFTGLNVQDKNNYPLNVRKKIFSSTNFQDKESCSFQGFFYLETLQKTGIATPCTTSASDPTLPNCNTGRYSICECTGANCSGCVHKGFIPLINMNDAIVLEALGAPDASRQGKASVQLTIKTQSSGDILDNSGATPLNPVKYAKDNTGTNTNDLNSYIYIETFVLPPLPFQKWTMITINREGRRFDIYYNSTLVLSKYATANVYPVTANKDINVGNSLLNGVAGFFSMYDTIQTAKQIEGQYKTVTTTKGSPLFNTNPPDIAFTRLSLDRLSTGAGVPNMPSLCSSGDCINSPKVAPAKPHYKWNTNYA